MLQRCAAVLATESVVIRWPDLDVAHIILLPNYRKHGWILRSRQFGRILAARIILGDSIPINTNSIDGDICTKPDSYGISVGGKLVNRLMVVCLARPKDAVREIGVVDRIRVVLGLQTERAMLVEDRPSGSP